MTGENPRPLQKRGLLKVTFGANIHGHLLNQAPSWALPSFSLQPLEGPGLHLYFQTKEGSFAPRSYH